MINKNIKTKFQEATHDDLMRWIVGLIGIAGEKNGVRLDFRTFAHGKTRNTSPKKPPTLFRKNPEHFPIFPSQM